MNHKIIFILVSILFLVGCATTVPELEEAKVESVVVVQDTLTKDTTFTMPKPEETINQSKIHYSNALIAVYDNDTASARYEFEMALEILRRVQDINNPEPWVEDETRLLTQKLTEDYVRYIKEHNEQTSDYEPSSLQEQISLLEPIEEVEGASGTFKVLDDREGHVTIIQNSRVDRIINFFETRGRDDFQVWLNRINRWEKYIKTILAEEDMPPELFYLSMIESGLNPRAYSYAYAAGHWQFISSTGNMYGLERNWYIDERFDPQKSAYAAIRYLKDLYEEFDDWYLAMAAYNAGERRVWRAIRREGTRNFWNLRTLPRQTRNYVPTFLAATIIAHHPEEFGFYIDPEPHYSVDTVEVTKSLDLYKIAEVLGVSVDTIKDLNPELRKHVTPTNQNGESYILKLPANTRERFLASLNNIPEADEIKYHVHYVRWGETLSTIARRYGVSVGTIMRANNLRSSHWIKNGQRLTIPVAGSYAAARNYSSSSAASSTSTRSIPTEVEGHVKITYLVKRGDTLGEIAEIYGTRASNIRTWNGLGYGQYIYPGDKLNIWVPEGSPFASLNSDGQSDETLQTEDGEYQIYVVRNGDTLWEIARQYGVELQSLRSWNIEKAGGNIEPGDRIRIAVN